MEDQKVFDAVADGLLAQNEKSTEKDICRYRGPRGLKCGIGFLIPDTLYSEDMEGHTVGTLMEEFPGIDDFEWNFDLVCELQELHDGCNPDEWRVGLHRIAKNFNLDASVLKGGAPS